MACELTAINLTNEQKAQVCGILSVGCDWQTAANFVGRSLADIRREMQNDSQFAADIQRAEAGAELSHMRTVQQAAKEAKNWRASVWWLERHAPERFARRAGVVTSRQIKAFIAMLADIVRAKVKNAEEQQQIVAQLHALADTVDQMLRDDSLNVAEATDADSTCDALLDESSPLEERAE